MSLSNFIGIIGTRALLLMTQGGYAGIFLLALLDRFLLSLLPSEAVLPLAGFLVAEGHFALLPVMILITLGNLAGDLMLYWLAAWGGRPLLEKYGKYFLVSRHDLDHTDRLFAKHGGLLVIIGRLLPIVRTFVPIPAGIVRMPFWQFTGYTIIGSLPYNLLLVLVGMKSGQYWEQLQPWLTSIQLLVAGGLVVTLIWYVYRHIKQKHLNH